MQDHNVISVQYLEFLSHYLFLALKEDRSQRPDNWELYVKDISPASILLELQKYNVDKDSLYGYLEDSFAFINDPMFGIILNCLIE